MKRDQVIVLGASSQIGLFAIPRLAAHGLRVWAVSRQPRGEDYPPLENVCWVSRPEELAGHGRLPRFLLSAGPLDLAVEWLDNLDGLDRAVAISTTSVLSKSESAAGAERNQMAAIAAAEGRVKSLCAALDADWCLLRPTLVYGCGMDRNVSLLARFVERFGFLPLARGAHGLRQPVHADDVAQVAVTALFKPAAGGLLTPVCGGSTVTYRIMAERVFAAFDRPCRIVELPAGLLAAATGLLGALGFRRALHSQMVRRQAVDLVFDDSPAREVLDFRPRKFRPGRADFRRPEFKFIRNLAVGRESQ